ncbi:hypothetical protein [Erythrobacter sp. HKB08]|uniref:hypothetical protein n=1 Tax=Erythrobacter sp. HKB08 TaxID=2502843 RepID=UPI00100884AB|nr:hypothetical protein [Erythrobacter sp. HKB08]
MKLIKALSVLFGTFWMAWVAYMAFSVPRDVDEAMNQPMDALGGSTIGQEIATAQAKAKQDQCEAWKLRAENAWNRSVEKGTLDRDEDMIAELDQQVARFCD